MPRVGKGCVWSAAMQGFDSCVHLPCCTAGLETQERSRDTLPQASAARAWVHYSSEEEATKWGGTAPCLQSPELWPEITEAHSRL